MKPPWTWDSHSVCRPATPGRNPPKVVERDASGSSKPFGPNDELERVVLVVIREVYRLSTLLRFEPYDPQHRFARRSNVVEAQHSRAVLALDPERRRVGQHTGHTRSPNRAGQEAFEAGLDGLVSLGVSIVRRIRYRRVEPAALSSPILPSAPDKQ